MMMKFYNMRTVTDFTNSTKLYSVNVINWLGEFLLLEEYMSGCRIDISGTYQVPDELEKMSYDKIKDVLMTWANCNGVLTHNNLKIWVKLLENNPPDAVIDLLRLQL